MRFLSKTGTYVGICLLAIYLLGSWHRVEVFKTFTGYHPSSDVGFFWSENALQYHYARELAEGRKVPAVDPLFEHPAGLKTREHLTIAMEYVDAFLYRIFGGDGPFHGFLMVCICYTTMLIIFPVFGIARQLSGQPWPGVYAAALYAVAMPGFARIMGSYGREHFALPLIFAGVWALLAAMQNRSRSEWLALISGVFFALALMSWHFSRFSVLLIVGVAFAVWLLRNRSDFKRIGLHGVIVAAPMIVVTLLHPALRYRLFHVGGDTHVWSLLWAKLVHWGRKPSEPSELAMETRFLWIEAFNSPDMHTWIYGYGWIPLFALIGCLLLWRRKKITDVVLTWMILTGCFLVLYLMIQRMHGFLIVMLCVLSAPMLTNFLRGGRVASCCFYLALAGLWMEGQKFYHYGEPTTFKKWADSRFPQPVSETIPDWQFNTIQLMDFLKREVDPGMGEGILARYALSPVIVAHANRPVILHSKAENPKLRETIYAYYQTLFGPAEDFWKFCREHDARWLVVDAETVLMQGPDSERFLADQVRLDKSTCAYQLHFEPENLTSYFTPVFQGARYRVYRVHDVKLETTPASFQFTEPLLFNEANFGVQTTETFEETRRDQVFTSLKRAVGLEVEGRGLLRRGQFKAAASVLNKAVEINIGAIGLRMEAAKANFKAGNRRLAFQQMDDEIKAYPARAAGYEIKARMLADERRFAEAMQLVENGLAVDPESMTLLQLRQQLQAIAP